MIYFREVSEPQIPAGSTFLRCWHVEYYDDDAVELGAMVFPKGIGFVDEFLERNVTQISYILVADQWRGCGIGRQIIDAIKKRWPDVVAPQPMSSEGAALIKSFGLRSREPNATDR